MTAPHAPRAAAAFSRQCAETRVDANPFQSFAHPAVNPLKFKNFPGLYRCVLALPRGQELVWRCDRVHQLPRRYVLHCGRHWVQALLRGLKLVFWCSCLHSMLRRYHLGRGRRRLHALPGGDDFGRARPNRLHSVPRGCCLRGQCKAPRI